jgi:integrase
MSGISASDQKSSAITDPSDTNSLINLLDEIQSNIDLINSEIVDAQNREGRPYSKKLDDILSGYYEIDTRGIYKKIFIILTNILPEIQFDEKNDYKPLSEILTKISKLWHKLVPNFHTADRMMSDIRLKIKPKFNNEYVRTKLLYNAFHVDDKLKQQKIKAYQQTVEQRASKQREINIAHLKSILAELLVDDSIWGEMAYILLNTGVRGFDLVDKSQFSIAKSSAGETKQGYITIHGVSKKRNDNLNFVNTRPVLDGKSNQTLKKIKSFREKLSKLPSDERNYKNPLNSTISKYFSKYGYPRVPNHQLRHIYASAAYYLFAPEGMSRLIFTAKVLGHESSSYVSSLAYESYHIVDRDPNMSSWQVDAKAKSTSKSTSKSKSDISESKSSTSKSTSKSTSTKTKKSTKTQSTLASSDDEKQ